MAKAMRQAPPTSFESIKFIFIGTIIFALFIFSGLWSISNPWPVLERTLIPMKQNKNPSVEPEETIFQSSNMCYENTNKVLFYDDTKLSYTINKPIKNWDDKRREWLDQHSASIVGSDERVLLVTGSQPFTCTNPFGDHLLLRFFKNKVDYCRIHGHDIYYNNAFLNPKMPSYWAKIPVIRAAMLAHPEVEWIYWVDSDAVFTDMDFKLPLKKYRNHNLVLDGWPELIYKQRSWVGINAGVFLIRNCQWSMDFMNVWANMGPKSPKYEKWGQILAKTLKDKMYPISDDQSALVYLILKGKDTLANEIYIENKYCFQGYWEGLVGTFDNITSNYAKLEKKVEKLRRRHAEKVRESYYEEWEKYLKIEGYEKGTGKRPFVTHFTGCQPCSGDHNPMYGGDSCWKGIEKALNFADNQVLRAYGLLHPT